MSAGDMIPYCPVCRQRHYGIECPRDWSITDRMTHDPVITPNTDKITQDEMIEMFGEAMPMEAVNLLWNSDVSMTIGEIRAELRQIATRRTTPVITEAMVEAALADLRDRRLLKWLFKADADTNQVPIGYVDGPIDLETQREIVTAIYLAMHRANPVVDVEGMVGRIMPELEIPLHDYQRGGDSQTFLRQVVRAAIEALNSQGGVK